MPVLCYLKYFLICLNTNSIDLDFRGHRSPGFIGTRILHGEGDGIPLQYSCLENPMDGGAWWAAVHGVAKSRRRLNDFTFTFHFHALEKEMATHSSVLAWRIPGTGEPGGLPSMGSHRVGHDWSDLAAAAAAGFYIEFMEVNLKLLLVHRFKVWESMPRCSLSFKNKVYFF